MQGAGEKIQPGKQYADRRSLKIVKEFAKAKFDESVDVAIRLGIDAKKSDQGVRGSTVLPHGTGKTVRVAVFCQPARRQSRAEAAGADVVGMEDLAEKMQGRRARISAASSPPLMPCASSAARPDPRSARPDAEPEGRHGHRRRRHRGQERQGRPGPVTATTRPASCIARSARPTSKSSALKENLHALLADLKKAKPASVEGRVHAEGFGVEHDGPRRYRRSARRCGLRRISWCARASRIDKFWCEPQR